MRIKLRRMLKQYKLLIMPDGIRPVQRKLRQTPAKLCNPQFQRHMSGLQESLLADSQLDMPIQPYLTQPHKPRHNSLRSWVV